MPRPSSQEPQDSDGLFSQFSSLCAQYQNFISVYSPPYFMKNALWPQSTHKNPQSTTSVALNGPVYAKRTSIWPRLNELYDWLGPSHIHQHVYCPRWKSST